MYTPNAHHLQWLGWGFMLILSYSSCVWHMHNYAIYGIIKKGKKRKINGQIGVLDEKPSL